MINYQEAFIGNITNSKVELYIGKDIDRKLLNGLNLEIFDVCIQLAKAKLRVDTTTVAQEMSKTHDGLEILDHLARCQNASVSMNNLEYVIEKLKVEYEKERVLRFSEEIKRTLITGDSVDTVISAFRDDLSSLADESDEKDIKTLVAEEYEKIEKEHSGEVEPGLNTGFSAVDRVFGSIKKKDLIFVAARPSIGKTVYALNALLNISIEHMAGFYSLEMGADRIARRLMLRAGQVSGNAVKSRNMTDDDWKSLAKGSSVLARRKLDIISSAKSMTAIRRHAMHKKAIGKPYEIIAIDYFQMLHDETNGNGNQYTDNLKKCKDLAKDLDIPVILISSVSRGCESRDDKRPMMSDLRNSGDIEFYADRIHMLYRDEYYYPDTDKKGIIEDVCRKNRDGQTGIVELAFVGDKLTIADLTNKYDNC